MSFVQTSIVGLLAVGFIYKALASYFRSKLRGKLTAMGDVPLLGLPRKGGKIQGTVVICGGSIAGLFSARVCSDHFENVIIVEPEVWVTTEEGLHDRHREASIPGSSASKRSRVFQYTSIHGTQLFSHIALRKLFPDFDREMIRAGGRLGPSAQQAHVSGVPFVGPYQKDAKNTPKTFYFTRPGYETTIRRLVLAHCSNVKYVAGSVTGLVPHKFGNYVQSVKVTSTVKSNNDAVTEIPATLVIDCTGPVQGGLKWLQDPRFHTNLDGLKESYDAKLAYTTAEFNIPQALQGQLEKSMRPFDYANGASVMLNTGKPGKDPKMLSIQRREGNYLHLTCGGRGEFSKIGSTADIKKYISKLPVSRPIPDYVHALVDFLDMHDVPVTYFTGRITPREYVKYTQAKQLPSNFIALGDSVSMLNPMRAQGCTKACIEAVTLNALLTRVTPVRSSEAFGDSAALPEDFGRTFFAMQAQRTGSLWQAHKTTDYAWGTTIPHPGDNPNANKLIYMRWYMSQLTNLATTDPQFASDLWHVDNFLAPSTDLFSPRTIGKVLWRQLF